SRSRCCLRIVWATLGFVVRLFRGQLPRPAPSRAYASPNTSLLRRKARFWPAGLSFGQAGLSPAGRLSRFQEFRCPPSLLTSRAWSHPDRVRRAGSIRGTILAAG